MENGASSIGHLIIIPLAHIPLFLKALPHIPDIQRLLPIYKQGEIS